MEGWWRNCGWLNTARRLFAFACAGGIEVFRRYFGFGLPGRAAGPHIAPDAMPGTEPPHVFGAYFKTLSGGMGAEVARPIRHGGMSQHIEQDVHFPAVGIAEHGAAIGFILKTV